MKARYVVKADSQDPKVFLELSLARRYAHTLPPGTVVQISDLEAKPGKPSTYVLKAGDKGVVKVLPSPGIPRS